MSVVNGQIANQTTFNNAFMSRTAATTSTVAKMRLANGDSADSGPAIVNTQKAINKLFASVGVTDEADTASNTYANQYFITNGDTYKVAIGKLDAQMEVHADHLAQLEIDQTAQNNRMTTIEGVNTAQESHLTTIDADQITQNNRLTAAEGVNTTQTSRLNTIDADQITQNSRLTAVEGVNTSQDAELANHESRITTLEGAPSGVSNVTAGTGIAVTTPSAGVRQVAIDSTVATLTGAQALTNKDIDGGTASNTSRLTIPKAAKTTLDALTRKQGTILFDTTSNKPYYDDGTQLKVIGSGSGGGGVNLITDGDAEGSNIFNLTKNTSAAARPDAGFVTSGVNITLTQSATNPLADLKSFLLSKPASNCQGNQAGINFTVPLYLRAKVQTIQATYIVDSGTFVPGSDITDGDLIVYIYDVTNGVFIEPSSIKFFSSSTSIAGSIACTFQTSATGVNYKLLFHVASTSALAWAIKLDQISVGPSTYVYGTPASKWEPYVPVITGFGTPTSVDAEWRQDGPDMLIRGKFTSGTSTAVEARFGLPSFAVSADTTIIPSLQHAGAPGSYSVISNSQVCALIEPSKGYLTFGIQSASSVGLAKANANDIFGTGNSFSFSARVPIQGWVPSVRMADGYEGRVISLMASMASGYSVGANAVIKYDTVNFDDVGSYDKTTGLATIKSSGRYRGSVLTYSSAAGINIIKVNGTAVRNLESHSISSLSNTSFVLDLKTGDTVGVYSDSAATIGGAGSNGPVNSFELEKIGSVVGAFGSPSIYAIAKTAAGQSITNAGTNVTVVFGTKEADTHGMMNLSTGVYTATETGLYEAESMINYSRATVSLTNNGTYSLKLAKNGTAYAQLDNKNFGAFTAGDGYALTLKGTRKIFLLQGETVSIMTSNTNGGGNAALTADDTLNYFTIQKVG